MITRELGLSLLQEMIRIRRFEEKSAELYSAGKIRGFLHLYIGQEAIAAGTMPLFRPEDNIVATYREHGHALARGIPAQSIMAEMYGKQEGCSRGRGGSMHLYDAEKRFFGGNAIVAGGIPLAVGLALASKMQNQNRVTVCYFGDGAVAEGEFHESLNLASLWKLPVLFLCENNFYAMGTPIKEHQAQTDLSLKAKGYNLPAIKVDGMDILKVQNSTRDAINYILENKGPYFIEFETYRFRAHSMYDPDLYRNKVEIEEWKKRDPIKTFTTYLGDQKFLSADDVSQIEAKLANELAGAIEFAEHGTLEPIEDLLKYVYTSEVLS
jgi:pyruvate dehydrogenase E1 component alpha subunit